MKIFGQFLIALAGTSAAACLALVGCGTTNNINTGGGTSGLGEACTRTFDCKGGLACYENVCLPSISSGDGGAGDGGDSGVTTGPHLGLINESCQTSHDCEAPLACVSSRCMNVNYNLTVTGKTCTGECGTAADCCELPAGASVSLGQYQTSDGGVSTRYLYASSVRCEDLLAYLGGDTSQCTGPLSSYSQADLARGCAFYQQYCQCQSNTWACNNNQCAYTAPCTQPAFGFATTATCPTATRTNPSLGSGTCNVTGGGVSGPGTCASGCSTAADCAGKPVTASSGSHTCSGADGGANNCTCYQSACYFACTKDVDCASGSTCDAATHLCKATGCTANSDCVQSKQNAQAQCVAGACQIACQSDIECNPPSTICSAGVCQTPGCSSDTDCAGAAHTFCAPAAPTSPYSSAVTN
jgi:hypothetical protein